MDQLIMPGSYRLGRPSTETLYAKGGTSVIGRGGNDTFVRDGQGTAGLLGGAGNDTYFVGGGITQIIDRGGQDSVVLAGRVADYVGAFIEGRDLLLIDPTRGEVLIVLEARGAGRIERFQDVDGVRLSASQVEALIYREGLGDIRYVELQHYTGDYSVDADTWAQLRRIDLALSELSWDNVLQHLAERDSVAPEAIADAIEFELLGRLDAEAQRVWHAVEGHASLAASRYQGFAEQLPELPERPSPLPMLSHEEVAQVALLYEAALAREPDTAGLNYFVDNLRSGQSLHDIAHSVYQAEEFRAQFAAFDDAGYIDQLYRNVLGRVADDAGKAYWLEDLAAGRSHADVLVSFAQSAENQANAAAWLEGLHFDTASGDWVL